MGFRLGAIPSGIGLALSGAVATEAWHRGMWGTLTGAALLAVWIVLIRAWRSGTERVPAAQAVLPAPPEIGSHRMLLDAAPTPMLAIQGNNAHALNRAARKLFATDDRVLPVPPALADGQASHFRHQGRSWRIDRVLLAAESRTVVTLIDIEQEERAAEARATAEMIQVLGHELLNGLAPIVSLADSGLAAIDSPAPDTQLLREILGTLTRQAEGLQRFVEAYRILARLPAPQLRSIPVEQLIEDLTRLCAGRWPQVAISVDVKEGPSRLMDRDQISQALWALIQNAAEAATADRGADARIELVVRHRDQGLAFEVRDNGNGIPPEHEALVFRAFHTTKPEGTGIGLSLARQIAHAHGGTLSTWRSDQTIFCLILPD
ncbi:sensor histidine kinase [Novosphingobium aerophilum]|uniref:sensor histidine kinase n=1 Tax=Novosphingobium TaxID=165696 RepID=UPI00163D5DDE|nr:HAMP domain-containing sensor histidine kinase [Novosphingobium sp. RL4]WRT95865.1 HAMP domain-containing sensor histidine kinase [Novosphingobium sp. RL4]